MQQCRRKGFTLIELLVVVGIIVLLVGILVPAVSRARESARRTQCMANLHSIGQAVRSYMNDSNDFYPPMAPMPSNTDDAAGRPAMSEILKPYVGGETKVFHCPSDRLIHPGSPGPTKGESTWFQWQGSSYEPRALLSTIVDSTTGKCWVLSQEFHAATSRLPSTGDMDKWNELAEDLPKMVLIHDYENFHGETSQPNNRMALYADFHVASMDETQTTN